MTLNIEHHNWQIYWISYQNIEHHNWQTSNIKIEKFTWHLILSIIDNFFYLTSRNWRSDRTPSSLKAQYSPPLPSKNGIFCTLGMLFILAILNKYFCTLEMLFILMPSTAPRYRLKMVEQAPFVLYRYMSCIEYM